jgi:hypothetical protein
MVLVQQPKSGRKIDAKELTRADGHREHIFARPMDAIGVQTIIYRKVC